MSDPISDASLRHLQHVADLPDLSGTRYEAVGHLGRGGMGTVYHVYDRGLDRPVALKVLSPVLRGDEIRRRLEREAKVLAALEHPGVVPVHDVGLLPDGRVFYAMKLVRGRRLDQVVADGPSLPDRLRLFLKVAETIGFAHSRGVVHRDIKPENIMVGAFGEVLVLDWGIAKVKDESAGDWPPPESVAGATRTVGDTQVGTVLGTPGYMSPEQAAGEVDRVDERSDVYSLGALLRYLLHGQSPGTPDPSRGDHEVSKRLEAVVAMAMAARPGDRYPEAAAMARDVTSYLDGAPMAAYRERWWERIGRIAWKYRTPLLLVLAYLVIRMVLLYFRR